MTSATTEAGLEARVRNLVSGALFKEQGNWAVGSPLLDRVMDELRPVLDDLLSCDAMLGAVIDLCREPYEVCAATGADLVRVSDVLAALASKGGVRNGA